MPSEAATPITAFDYPATDRMSLEHARIQLESVRDKERHSSERVSSLERQTASLGANLAASRDEAARLQTELTRVRDQAQKRSADTARIIRDLQTEISLLRKQRDHFSTAFQKVLFERDAAVVTAGALHIDTWDSPASLPMNAAAKLLMGQLIACRNRKAEYKARALSEGKRADALAARVAALEVELARQISERRSSRSPGRAL